MRAWHATVGGATPTTHCGRPMWYAIAWVMPSANASPIANKMHVTLKNVVEPNNGSALAMAHKLHRFMMRCGRSRWVKAADTTRHTSPSATTFRYDTASVSMDTPRRFTYTYTPKHSAMSATDTGHCVNMPNMVCVYVCVCVCVCVSACSGTSQRSRRRAGVFLR